MADEQGAAGQPEHPHRGPEQLPGRRTTYDPDQPDIGEEHNSTTFVGEVPGGPERVEEPESPKGLAGLEPDWPESDKG